MLSRYTALVKPSRKSGRIALIRLQQRLLSSVDAFCRTLRRYAQSVETASAVTFPESSDLMAEIEIGILNRQCLDRRIPDRDTLRHEVDAWQQERNDQERTIEWTFTRQDADLKLGRHYVPQLTV